MKRKNQSQLEIEIRRRVEAKYDERNALLIHFVSYAGVNALVWATWLFSAGGFPWPLFVTVFWGIGMAGHALDYYHKHGGGARKREERIDEEVRRHLERLEGGRFDVYDDEAVTEGADVYALDNVELRRERLADDGELSDRVTMKRKAAIKSEEEIRRAVKKDLEAKIFAVVITPFGLMITGPGLLYTFAFYVLDMLPQVLLFVAGCVSLAIFFIVTDSIEKYGWKRSQREEEMEKEVQRQLASEREREEKLRAVYAEEGAGADVFALDSFAGRGVALGDDGELTEAEYKGEERLRAATNTR